MTPDKNESNSQIAQDVVLKWTSDKNVSIRMHGGITTGNDILLTDCIKEALDAKDLQISSLNEQLETERMRLAACGTASLGYFTDCKEEYKSASLEDTLQLYSKYKSLTAKVERYKELRLKLMNEITDLIINRGDASGGYRYKDGWSCLAPIKQTINEVFESLSTEGKGEVRDE